MLCYASVWGSGDLCPPLNHRSTNPYKAPVMEAVTPFTEATIVIFPPNWPRWGRGERCSLGQMQMEKASDYQLRREKLGRLHCPFKGRENGSKTRFEVPKFDDFDDEVEKCHRDQQKVKKWILDTPHHRLTRDIKSRYRFGFTKYSTNVCPRDQKRYSRWWFQVLFPSIVGRFRNWQVPIVANQSRNSI